MITLLLFFLQHFTERLQAQTERTKAKRKAPKFKQRGEDDGEDGLKCFKSAFKK